jgi:hypothetical protein
VVIKDSGYVGVTIVTAEIVAALTVCSVRLVYVIVKLFKVVDLKPHVFVALTESEVVFRHVMRPCEIIDDSVGATDASVADAWDKP